MTIDLPNNRTAALKSISVTGEAIIDLTTPAGNARNVCAQLPDWPECERVEIGEDVVTLYATDEEGTEDDVGTIDAIDLATMLDTALTPDLAGAKVAKLASLKTEREALESAGVTVSGTPIQTDPRSIQRITGAFIRAQTDPDFAEQWKISEGVYIPVDQATMLAVGNAVFAHISGAFARERSAAAAVEAAETIEAVEAVEL